MFKSLIAAGFALALLLGSGQVVHATGVNFNVKPVLPANQVDTKLPYFNLLVSPSATQSLAVTIQNTDTGSHQFLVQTNRATTNAAGSVDYSVHGSTPTAGAPNIETLMPKPKTYTIAPRAERTIHLQLTAPKTTWAGIILGAIRVSRVDTQTSGSGQVNTANTASYTIGLQLQATKALSTPNPNLTFGAVKANQSGNAAAITQQLNNNIPAIQKDVSVKTTVQHAGKTVLNFTQAGLHLAPNSAMTIDLNPNKKSLAAGDYTVTTTAKIGSKTWRHQDQFTLAATHQVQATAHQPLPDTMASFPIWAVGLMIVIVLGLVLVLWRLLRHHR